MTLVRLIGKMSMAIYIKIGKKPSIVLPKRLKISLGEAERL